MRKIFVFLFIALSMSVYSQTIKFEVVYGGGGSDNARSIVQTYDTGYAIAGSSTSGGSGNSDIFIMKLDKFGDYLWMKNYGGGGVDWAYSIKQTTDSGLILAGMTNSFGSGGYDAYLIKTNANGDTLWTKTIGGVDWDFSYFIEETPDHGFILGGSTFSTGPEKMLLVRLDASGSIVWQKSYYGNDGGKFRCVRTCLDSGFIAAGEIQSGSDKNILLMKVNSAGDSLWSKMFGDTMEDIGYYVEETPDTGFILSGKFTDIADSNAHLAVIKTDSLGNSTFEKHFDGNVEDMSYTIHSYFNDGYIVSGYTKTYGAGGKDFRLIKVKPDGNYDWGGSYGGASDDEAFDMQITSDNGFVLVGETYSYGNTTPNTYVLKTDSDGNATGVVVIGINELNLETENNIQAFPNPCSRAQGIHINLRIEGEPMASIIMYDLFGRIVLQNDFNKEIFLKEGLPSAGVYIAKVDKGKTIKTFKIVIID